MFEPDTRSRIGSALYPSVLSLLLLASCSVDSDPSNPDRDGQDAENTELDSDNGPDDTGVPDDTSVPDDTGEYIPCIEGSCWDFEAETDFQHNQGIAEGEGWACHVSEHTENQMLWGPYTQEIQGGWFTADFRLMGDHSALQGNTTDGVLGLDVYDAESGTILAKDTLYRAELRPYAYASHTLLFQASPDAKLEFRAYWTGTANVNFDKVQVRTTELPPCYDNNSCTLDYEDESGSCVNEEMALRVCDAVPCPVDDSCLYTIDTGAMTEEEATMIASLQGILAQHRPAIWLGEPGNVLPDLELEYGVLTQPVDDPWELVERFSSQISGYLLSDFYGAQSSLSVASSLSGIFGAVIADVSVEQQLVDRGLLIAQDVRDKDEMWVLEEYAGYFSNEILIEQLEAPNIDSWYLRDLAASHTAFTWHEGNDPDFRQQVINEIGAGNLPYVLGWASEVGGGEYSFVLNSTLAGASVIPADFSNNLSVLMNVQGADTWVPQADTPPPFEPGKHYVAFVLSDGDNLQWMQGTFNKNSQWWSSPLRGTFPMTWGISTPMVQVAPSLLSYLSRNATGMDGFVGGPSGAGYTLPSYHPDIKGHAERTSWLAGESNVRMFTLLDSTYDGGSILSSIPYLEQPNIDGVLYDSYGENDQGLLLYNGKLAMEYTHYLWKGNDSPDSLANKLNTAPRDPVADIDSYSLVFVHCWSEWDLNEDGVEDAGSMEAVHSVVSALDSTIEVVTAPQLLDHITTHFEGEICGNETCGGTEDCNSCPTDCGVCTTWSYDALTDFGHNTGQEDSGGWSATPGVDAAGHMAYGPYVTGLDSGDYRVSFSLMIDDLAAADGQAVVGLDVHDAASGLILASEAVYGSDFTQENVHEDFILSFTNASGTNLEFRIWWHGYTYVHFGGAELERLP